MKKINENPVKIIPFLLVFSQTYISSHENGVCVCVCLQKERSSLKRKGSDGSATKHDAYQKGDDNGDKCGTARVLSDLI